MKNTTRYFDTIKDFRADSRELEKLYRDGLSMIESYKGSLGYENAKDELARAHEEGLRELRQRYSPLFDEIINDMERYFKSKPMAVPTAEQMALIQMLKMRDRVSRSELRQAANTMNGCPAALQALQEIARKSNIPFGIEDDISDASFSENLRVLRMNTGKMLSKMKHVDNRRTYLNTGDYDMYRLDVDPVSEADCLRIFGGIRDTEKFSAAVNGVEA